MTSCQTWPAIERDPDGVSGAWVFCETRMPVAALFENLRDGATVQQFLDWFPGVERWRAKSVFNHDLPARRYEALCSLNRAIPLLCVAIDDRPVAGSLYANEQTASRSKPSVDSVGSQHGSPRMQFVNDSNVR